MFWTPSQSFDEGSAIVSTENCVPSWQAASAEAIFMGCCSNISLDWISPVIETPAKARTPTMAPMRRDLIHTVWSVLSRPGSSFDEPTMTLPSAPTVSIPSLRR